MHKPNPTVTMIKILHIFLAVYLPKNAGAQKTSTYLGLPEMQFLHDTTQTYIQLICCDKVTNGLTPVFQMKH